MKKIRNQQVLSSPWLLKTIVIITGIIIFIGLIALLGTYYDLSSNQANLSTIPYKQNTLSPTPSRPKPLPTDENTTRWNTYHDIGIQFLYPSDARLSEYTANGQRVVSFKLSNTKEFSLDRFQVETENEAPYNQTNITKTFNGITWKVVLPKMTDQFCDAGMCGKTAPSYYVYKNGYRYSFAYYSDDLQDTIERILETVSFVD